jgi:hypothetical protein
VTAGRGRRDDGKDPFQRPDVYDELIDVTSPEVTERLKAAGFDMGVLGTYFGVGASAAWLLDWLGRRGSVDIISDAGEYTAWFQRGDKFMRVTARTKSDTYAELVLMVLAEGNGTPDSENL